MPARSRMRHRLYLQRNGAGTDPYGATGPPVWDDVATIPGHVWIDKEDTYHKPPASPVVAMYRAIVPLGVDVRKEDRILKVEDRNNKELFGKMDIDAVMRRKDHHELKLKGYDGC